MLRTATLPRGAVIGMLAFCVGLAAVLINSRGVAHGRQNTIDLYSVMAVPQDLPAGFVLEAPASVREGVGFGMRYKGRVTNPNSPPSTTNQILETATIRLRLARSSAEPSAWMPPRELQTPAVPGTYTGTTIGDRCFHSKAGPSWTSAPLWFWRGLVLAEVDVEGTTGRNWVAATEALARTLVERIDASSVLAGSASGTVQVGGRSLASRRPNSLTIVHMDEYANAAGATCALDIAGGTVTLVRNGHTLKINIGRKEAWFDGGSITLAFPALRHGKDQVYCPLDTLRRLGP